MTASMSAPVLFDQKEAARYLGVSTRWLRDQADLRPRELPGHGEKRKPLLRYHKNDLDAQIAKWAEEQRGRSRRKA